MDDSLVFSGTSEHIINSLISLMESESYKNISTASIARKAGISRQALYLHFENKDAILNALIMRLFREIMSEVSTSGARSPEQLVETYTSCIKKNSSMLSLLAKDNLGPYLSNAFTEEFIRRPPVLSCQKDIDSEYERIYFNSFYVSAFIEVYTRWLSEGMKTPENELNRILSDIMSGSYFK